MLHPLQAALLGVVEGFTEFLPVSSTGHLILASWLLHLHGETVNSFAVVIQAGSLGAVLGLYRGRVACLWRGLAGCDRLGRALLINLVISFLPSAIAGAMLHRTIKERLFSVWPVIAALAAGGLFMVWADRRLFRAGEGRGRTIDSMTPGEALLIGLAQCLSLWPGTSRAMVTVSAGLALRLPATVAAEYSFLLALPTLGSATLFDLAVGGPELVRQAGWVSVLAGFVCAALVATLAIQGFVGHLARRGLAPFGWYRLGLAAAVCWMMPRT